MTNNTEHIGVKLSILVILVASFTWITYWLVCGVISSYPNAEDLSLSHPRFNIGAWSFIRYTLASYDGRYFVNLLHTITPLAFKFTKGYPIVGIVGVISFSFSAWFFFSSTIDGHPLQVFFLSLIFTMFHFATVPSIVHELFWMSSSLVYLWSWTFTLLFWGAVLHTLNVKHWFLKKVWVFFSAITLFAALGINEMMLPLFVIVIGLLIYKRVLSHFTPFVAFIALLTCTLVFFFIASPGIQERVFIEKMGAPEVSILQRLETSIVHQWRYLFEFVTHPMIICTAILMVVFANNFSIKANVRHLFPPFQPIQFVGICILLGFCMTLPYYLPIGFSSVFPDRIFNTVNTLSMLTLIFSLLYFAKQLVVPSWLKLTTVCLTGFVLLYSNNNINKIISDFKSGKVAAFWLQVANRQNILDSVAKQNCLYKKARISEITQFPKNIYSNTDIVQNRKKEYWNAAYELYYDIDRVMLTTDSLD